MSRVGAAPAPRRQARVAGPCDPTSRAPEGNHPDAARGAGHGMPPRPFPGLPTPPKDRPLYGATRTHLKHPWWRRADGHWRDHRQQRHIALHVAAGERQQGARLWTLSVTSTGAPKNVRHWLTTWGTYSRHYGGALHRRSCRGATQMDLDRILRVRQLQDAPTPGRSTSWWARLAPRALRLCGLAPTRSGRQAPRSGQWTRLSPTPPGDAPDSRRAISSMCLPRPKRSGNTAASARAGWGCAPRSGPRCWAATLGQHHTIHHHLTSRSARVKGRCRAPEAR
jgi:hypothetical protein